MTHDGRPGIRRRRPSLPMRKFSNLYQNPTTSFSRALGRPHFARVIGVEHEFGVFEDGKQIDFSERIHDLQIPGSTLHPTNKDMFFTADGFAVIADGVVAEVATPPVTVEPSSVTSVATWAESARLELLRMTPGLDMYGGSTHISISTGPNDRLSTLYARTFAAALMLLMDQPTSPGMLIRPRPGRLELCGEFVVGASLADAALFALGSVAAVEAHIEGTRDALPDFLDVTLERGRRRYGWYVDREAFGSDLYERGRDTKLRLADGSLMKGQDFLEACWDRARSYAARVATPKELNNLDRVIDGRDPLPMEAGSFGEVPKNPDRQVHDIGAAVSVLRTPIHSLTPAAATWDWVAWEVSNKTDSIVATVPRPLISRFIQQTTAGRLDDSFGIAIAANAQLAALQTVDQTASAGLFSAIKTGPALLPVDRYGIGNAPASSTRLGKKDIPPPESGFLDGWLGHGPWSWIGLGVVLTGLVFLALSVAGVFDQVQFEESDCVGVECTETVLDSTFDCEGVECDDATPTESDCVGVE